MSGFTFSPNANGVGANVGAVLIARTPMALRLNVSHQAAWNIAGARSTGLGITSNDVRPSEDVAPPGLVLRLCRQPTARAVGYRMPPLRG